jgi:hypothetical protein
MTRRRFEPNTSRIQNCCLPPAFKLVSCPAIFSSETSVDFERITCRYTPEDSTLHNHRCQNLKSCSLYKFPSLLPPTALFGRIYPDSRVYLRIFSRSRYQPSCDTLGLHTVGAGSESRQKCGLVPRIVHDRQSAGQSVLEQSTHLGLKTRSLLLVCQLRSCSCGAPSLTRGRVCLLYMLLALASATFLWAESLGTRDHILLSQLRDFPFRRLLRLAGSRWRYSIPPPHGELSLNCQLLLASRYVASVRITTQKTHPLPSNECSLLLRTCISGVA